MSSQTIEKSSVGTDRMVKQESDFEKAAVHLRIAKLHRTLYESQSSSKSRTRYTHEADSEGADDDESSSVTDGNDGMMEWCRRDG
ncbi:hypothetical protein MMC17_006676 [Xylographa soralifera]|nr:hypothetical protein [Xylographa soralifera]